MELAVEVIEGKTFWGAEDTWVTFVDPFGVKRNVTLETAREIAAALYHYDLAKHVADA